jgi:hypothetical protein
MIESSTVTDPEPTLEASEFTGATIRLATRPIQISIILPTKMEIFSKGSRKGIFETPPNLCSLERHVV